MSFYGGVSSEYGFDWLAWYLDGDLIEGVSGYATTVTWLPFTFAVPPGSHTIAWSYIKDGTGTEGLDAAWIDGVMVMNFDGTPKLATPKLPAGYIVYSQRDMLPAGAQKIASDAVRESPARDGEGQAPR